MTKTVTIDAPIEVRKTGPDRYQFVVLGDAWSVAYSESAARSGTSVGARAIVQAIDSGAFRDPLPTAEGVYITIPGAGAFVLIRDLYGDLGWASTGVYAGTMWHTPEQVQSYGPFEVLYDPEAQS